MHDNDAGTQRAVRHRQETPAPSGPAGHDEAGGTQAFELPRQLGNRGFTRHIVGAPTAGPVLRSPERTQGAGPLDPEIEGAIRGAQGAGLPLDERVRHDMEAHLGADLSTVRVHNDSRGDTLSRSVQAEAFTTGADIFFRSGAYSPQSRDGRKLLAHELTHVVQQASGTVPSESRVSHPDDPHEREAAAVADAVAGSPAGAVHRLPIGEEPDGEIPFGALPASGSHVHRNPETATRPTTTAPSEPATGTARDAEGNPIEHRAGKWYLAERPAWTTFPLAQDADHRLVPINPNAAFLALRLRCQQVMEEQLAHATRLQDAGDLKWLFAKVYHHVSRFELENIDGGTYRYPHMKMQQVLLFHTTYQQNLLAWEEGRKEEVESNWRVAFKAAEDMNDGSWWRARSHEISHALLPSIQAHIRFDLPRAIAAAFINNYRGIPGASLEAFRADFAEMSTVFDRASAAIAPEIEAQMLPIDPGFFTTLRDAGFPFFFHIGIERNQAWEKADTIVDQGHRGRDGTEQQMRALIGTAHPFSGAAAFTVNEGAVRMGGVQDITDYDWLNQPGARPAPPGPAPQAKRAPAPPPFPEHLYFRVGHPRTEGADDPGLQPGQRLEALDALAAWTREVRGATIRVIGRASADGTEEANRRFSRNRAVALWFLLSDRGADLTHNRVVLESAGQEGATRDPEWRRADIAITRLGESKESFTPPNANLPSEIAP